MNQILDLTAQTIVCRVGQALFNSELANGLPHQMLRKIVRMARMMVRRTMGRTIARMTVKTITRTTAKMIARRTAKTMSRMTLMIQIME
jgi:hypothetical protein